MMFTVIASRSGSSKTKLARRNTGAKSTRFFSDVPSEQAIVNLTAYCSAVPRDNVAAAYG